MPDLQILSIGDWYLRCCSRNCQTCNFDYISVIPEHYAN
jgi:hypothetical protein